MTALSIDFETRSPVDLKKTGVYPYAEHPDTDIWCMAYAFGDEEPQLWVPQRHGAHMIVIDECPNPWQRIFDHVREGGEIRAWNAQFERIIWWLILTPRYGFPRPDREQFVDTAAEAAAMALPRSLDYAAKALGLEMAKDMEGYRLMMQMAKPRKPRKGEKKDALLWWDEAEKRERLFEYCRQDVVVEREIARRLRSLSDYERQVYLLDQRMNDRGVMIDVPLMKAAKVIVSEGMERANVEIDQLTDGEVSGVTKVGDLTRWLQERGIDAPNIAKDTLRDLLAGDDLDDDSRRAIELRSESAKSSTAKLESMDRVRCSDDRARGLLLYHGAGTGRWSGKLIQPQNFPRGEVKDAERFIPAVLFHDYETVDSERPALVVISSLLRSMFIAAPGYSLMAGDYAQIEARVLAWIAEQDDLVSAFAAGAKIYEEMGGYIYSVSIDDVTPSSVARQVGKGAILGCGFGMGADTFETQTKKQTGIQLARGERDEEGNLLPGETDEAQRAIDAYREKYPRIKQFWYDIERAALRAVRDPGVTTQVGRDGAIRYTVRGQFLWCILPSGRPLAYAKPIIKDRKTPWGEVKPSLTYMGVNSYTRKWQRHQAYGGLLTENVVQAMARDLIAAALLRLEREGYRPILSVHDEVIAEPDLGHGSLDEFLDLMKTRPRWAEGLPVAVDGWTGDRYRK